MFLAPDDERASYITGRFRLTADPILKKATTLDNLRSGDDEELDHIDRLIREMGSWRVDDQRRGETFTGPDKALNPATLFR